jgi:serine/threonine protein phosphatase 1
MSIIWSDFFGARAATSPLAHHKANAYGRDFVVGDMHGCFALFRAALAGAGFRPGKDRVFSVGDLVDRGPQSMECLKLLEKPWFYACKGNHEEMLTAHLERPLSIAAYESAWLYEMAPSFVQRRAFAGQWLPLLRKLPYVRVVGEGKSRFQLVHAELLDQSGPVDNQMLDSWKFVSERSVQKHACYGRTLLHRYKQGKTSTEVQPGLSPTYCGHTIVSGALQINSHNFLDQGAFLQYALPLEKRGQSGIILVEPASGRRWRGYLDGGRPIASEESEVYEDGSDGRVTA